MEKSDLELFFEDPGIIPSRAGRKHSHPNGSGKCTAFGTLYKLRREMITCYGKKKTAPTPWAAAMLVFSGIDLMACCRKGKNDNNAIGPRFQDFIDDCFPPISKPYKQQFWSLRNCLLHNFTGQNSVTNEKFRLVLDSSPTTFTSEAENLYQVNLNQLLVDFEYAIDDYKSKITHGSVLSTNFNLMFSKIGYMLVYEQPSLDAGRFTIPINMISSGTMQLQTTLSNFASGA